MPSRPLFDDRKSAGQALAYRLARLRLTDPVILAMPRGGVPIAAEIARVLHAPVELVFVRKIGVPTQPELAAAAVVDGSDAEIIANEDVMAQAGLTHQNIRELARPELAEINRRRRRIPVEGRELILVDDGIATGASVRAALAALRRKRPRRLILAVPIAPVEAIEALESTVDVLICLASPEPFDAIGRHYRDFHQVPDDEVVRCLDEAAEFASLPGAAPSAGQ